MKKLFYFILLVTMVSSCKDEPILGPSGTVTLNLHAKYAGQPLKLDQAYPIGTSQIKFNQFNFFISNVTLLESETEDETDLMEVSLANFAANDEPSYTFRTVPAVKYRGIKISIGVPSGLNKSSVQNYGAGHPLKQAFDSHFWDDGNSFFFMKMAGTYGTPPAESPFELYPAKNSNFKTVTLLKTFTLDDGQTLDINLSIDVLKLLQDADNQPIDFTNPANLSTYNPANDNLSALLMGNFATALEVE